MIVSDHGMTESGNHGGSTYEETDSLALFVGLGEFSDASTTNNIANQVDVAPTLALLFGVPIPKNNVGILMAGVFNSLTDDEHLRLLELNSWQLFQLLEAQLPNFMCGSFKCSGQRENIGPRTGRRTYDSVKDTLCCLYLDAASLHESWKSEKGSRSTGGDDCSNIILAYHKFLRASSEWLSHRATDRPVGTLAFGVAAMLVSCLVLLALLYRYACEMSLRKEQIISYPNSDICRWCLDENFTVAVVCSFILSMGSSSMVEEEQYIWHFMTSSLFLVLFRKTIQSFTAMSLQNLLILIKEERKRGLIQVVSTIVILTSGRILRGWHQGGVNWTYLPDISKWLEQAGNAYTSSLQLVSGILLIITSFFVLLMSAGSKRTLVMIIASLYLFPGLLVLHRIIKYQDSAGYGATLVAQIFYCVLSISTIGTCISVPWLMPLKDYKESGHELSLSQDISCKFQPNALLQGTKDSVFLMGWACVFSWCLLQLLLQQPINSMPLFLVFIQILATVWYSSSHDLQWVEVAALYFLGMAGHFGLGNTNTLATIDVAGAFIGVSSHSTLLSGILMFVITYASPMLSLLSLVMYISVKDVDRRIHAKDMNIGEVLKMNLGFPCLVPLGLNSIFLTAYTIVLLLMRNHLFIWSVFSPKYLYVCATTACVCIGVSLMASIVVYTVVVLAYRRR